MPQTFTPQELVSAFRSQNPDIKYTDKELFNSLITVRPEYKLVLSDTVYPEPEIEDDIVSLRQVDEIDQDDEPDVFYSALSEFYKKRPEQNPDPAKRSVGFLERVLYSIAEEATLGLYDPNITEAESVSEKIAAVTGGIIGFAGTALIPGKVFGSAVRIAGMSASKVGRVAKLLRLKRAAEIAGDVKRASRIDKTLGIIYKGESISKKTGKAYQISKDYQKIIAELSGGGIMRSKIPTVYHGTVLKLAETNPKLAQLSSIGLMNLFTFGTLGQARFTTEVGKQAYREAKEQGKPIPQEVMQQVVSSVFDINRAKQLLMDAGSAVAFTVAHVPIIKGWKNAGKTEAGALLAAGMYLPDFGRDETIKLEDRLIHGMGLVAFHGMMRGLGKEAIKQQQINELSTTIGEVNATKLVRSIHNERLIQDIATATEKGSLLVPKSDPTSMDKSIFIVRRVAKPKGVNIKPHIIAEEVSTGKQIVFEGKDMMAANRKMKKLYKDAKIEMPVESPIPAGPTKEEIANAKIGGRVAKLLEKVKSADRSYKIEKKRGKYHLKLYYKYSHKGSRQTELKSYDKLTGRKLVFNSEQAAKTYGTKNWTGKNSLKVINDASNRYKILQAENSGTPEYQMWLSDVKRTSTGLKNSGLTLNKEKQQFVKMIFPDSQGSLKNLNVSQLHEVRRQLPNNAQRNMMVKNINFIPDANMNRNMKVNNNFAALMGKMVLPAQSVLEYTNQKIGKAYAHKMRSHGLEKRILMKVAQDYGRFLPSMTGMSRREINKHAVSLIDEAKFGNLKDKAFEKKYSGVKTKSGLNSIDTLKEAHRSLMDRIFIAMAEAGAPIRNGARDGKKEPVFYVEDMKGRKVTFQDPRDIIRIITEGKNEVINANGKKVKINRKTLRHHYEKDYVPHAITDRFNEISGRDESTVQFVLNYMLKNDPEIRKAEIKYGTERALEIANEKFSDVRNLNTKFSVYGQQWSRSAKLPAILYYSKEPGGFSIIKTTEIAKPNGKPFKVGEHIKDARGNKLRIDKVVDVYERQYDKVMGRYIDAASNFAATYKVYGTADMKFGSIARDLAILKDQSGEPVSDLLRAVLKQQISGSESPAITQAKLTEIFGHPVNIDRMVYGATRGVSSIGLSGPLSGVKNFLLGQVQNSTQFGFYDTGLAWKRMFWNPERIAPLKDAKPGSFEELQHTFKESWNAAKGMSADIGATSTSVYDLFQSESRMLRGLQAAGLMKPTEFVNRMTSVMISDIAMERYFNVLGGVKKPSTLGVSRNHARTVLKDILKIPEREYFDLIKKTEDHGGFDLNWVQSKTKRLARNNAHASAQGIGDAPYLPEIFGKKYLKPLSLFYRIAFRMTDSVYRTAIKPAVTYGNPSGILKYAGLSTVAGNSLYSLYHALYGEERRNIFKDVTHDWYMDFVRAEGLGIFSNAFDEFGAGNGSLTANIAVLRTTQNLYSQVAALAAYGSEGIPLTKDGKLDPSGAYLDAVQSTLRLVAGYNTAERIIQNMTDDTQKRFKNVRRRLRQYNEAFKSDIKYDPDPSPDYVHTAHYNSVKNAFWLDDDQSVNVIGMSGQEAKAMRYYMTKHYLTNEFHKNNADVQMSEKAARLKAKKQLKQTISALRPIPTSWRKREKGAKYTQYSRYNKQLDDKTRKEDAEMERIYQIKKREFMIAINKYKKKYDSGRTY